MTKRRWKFAVETEDDGTGYLLQSGEVVRDPSAAEDWIGTDAAADVEAMDRADRYEGKIAGVITKITYESQGKVFERESKTIIEGTLGAEPSGWEGRP